MLQKFPKLIPTSKNLIPLKTYSFNHLNIDRFLFKFQGVKCEQTLASKMPKMFSKNSKLLSNSNKQQLP